MSRDDDYVAFMQAAEDREGERQKEMYEEEQSQNVGFSSIRTQCIIRRRPCYTLLYAVYTDMTTVLYLFVVVAMYPYVLLTNLCMYVCYTAR